MADPEYFTLTEFRTMSQMAEARYSEAKVLAAAAGVTATIERVVGTSFVSRTVTDEILNGTGTDRLILRAPYVLEVLSATVGTDPALTTGLTAFGGVLFNRGLSWAEGWGNVKVSYRAGYSDAPPADLKWAAMTATRYRLLETASNSAADSRRTSMSTDGTTYGMVTAGPDRPFGFPDVDAVVVDYRDRLRPVRVA